MKMLWFSLVSVLCISTTWAQEKYIWWGDSSLVQYGIPETDDRAVRLDCEEGRLSISGPSRVAIEDGVSQIMFEINGAQFKHTVTGGEGGDGENWTAAIKADDPIVKGLIAGKPLKIAHGPNKWVVPGRGSAKVLKALISSCRKQ